MGKQACRQHTCVTCWFMDGCCCLATACSQVAVSSICIEGPQADLVCLCLLAVVLKLPSCLQVISSSICGHGAVLPCKQHSFAESITWLSPAWLDGQTSCFVQVIAVSLHNPNLLYQFTNSRMDLGQSVQEVATEECYRRLVVGNLILMQDIQGVSYMQTTAQ